MDPVTHSLLGASLSAAGLRRLSTRATPTLVLAANAPDIDIVAHAFGGYSSLAWRRGITHGIPALLILPFIVAGGVLWWDRRSRRTRGEETETQGAPSPWGLLALAYIGVFSHPAFDWVNNYGMRWLAPLDWGWSYGDAIFILDPWLWLLLGGPLFLHCSGQWKSLLFWTLLGLVMTFIVLATALVPLVAKVIWVTCVAALILLRRHLNSGASGTFVSPSRRGRTGERTARFGVGVAAAYVILMVLLTPLAERIAVAEASEIGVESIVDSMVGPVPANPLGGEVILRTEDGYWRGTFSWLRSPRVNFDPVVLRDSPRDERVGAAEMHPDAQHFLTWARFPWYQVSEDGDGWVVEIRDVRYLDRGGNALSGVRIELPGPVAGEPSPSPNERDAAPDSLLYAATFEAAWARIRETHYDPEMRGVDWEGVRSELLPRATVAGSEDELREILREMLGRLGESHFVLIPAGGSASLDGEVGEGDPGIEMRWVEGELLVTRVRGGSSAFDGGVRLGWVIESIHDVPVDSIISEVRSAGMPESDGRQIEQWLPIFARNHVMGAVGSSVAIRFRDERNANRTIELLRDPPVSEPVRIGNLPPVRAETGFRIVELPGGGQAGVISWSAWLPSTVPLISEAVDALREMDGIILDLRGNPGGLGALVMGVGGHFLDGGESLGSMQMRETTLRFVTNPQRVNPLGERVEPYAGPLAILIDPLSASTSEIFAAGMQSLGRAHIFGERSSGQALPSLITPLPNGDRLMHAVADFVAPNGARLEGAGVVPDVGVSLRRDALLQGRDPVVDAALEWIRTQR